MREKEKERETGRAREKEKERERETASEKKKERANAVSSPACPAPPHHPGPECGRPAAQCLRPHAPVLMEDDAAASSGVLLLARCVVVVFGSKPDQPARIGGVRRSIKYSEF